MIGLIILSDHGSEDFFKTRSALERMQIRYYTTHKFDPDKAVNYCCAKLLNLFRSLPLPSFLWQSAMSSWWPRFVTLNNILRINCPLPPAAPILWTVQIQRQHRRSHLGSARTDIACELVLQESDCNFWAWMVQFLLLSLGIPYGLRKGHYNKTISLQEK